MVAPYGGHPAVLVYTRALDDVLAIALIMFAINNKTEWVRKYILENPVLNFIGKISYGIYLYHFTLGQAYDLFIAGYAKTHHSIPLLSLIFTFPIA